MTGLPPCFTVRLATGSLDVSLHESSVFPDLLDGGLAAPPEPHQQDPGSAGPGAVLLQVRLLRSVTEAFRKRTHEAVAAAQVRLLLVLNIHVGPQSPACMSPNPRVFGTKRPKVLVGSGEEVQQQVGSEHLVRRFDITTNEPEPPAGFG